VTGSKSRLLTQHNQELLNSYQTLFLMRVWSGHETTVYLALSRLENIVPYLYGPIAIISWVWHHLRSTVCNSSWLTHYRMNCFSVEVTF